MWRAIGLVGRLVLGTSHDGEEAKGRRLLLVEEIGEAEEVACRALAAEHGEGDLILADGIGEHTTCSEDDVVATAGGREEAQQGFYLDGILFDGALQVFFAFLQRTLSLWVYQQLLQCLALKTPEQQEHPPVDERQEV